MWATAKRCPRGGAKLINADLILNRDIAFSVSLSLLLVGARAAMCVFSESRQRKLNLHQGTTHFPAWTGSFCAIVYTAHNTAAGLYDATP